MLKNWKTWLTWIFSPMAIGFYITMVTVMLTVKYYDDVNQGTPESNPVISALYTLDLKLFDGRLNARGPRPVHKDVALLAIDERAVETIGRWPFPRDIVGKAIEQAFSHGAKVLAFDIVFSEPQRNPISEIIDRTQGALSPEIQSSLLVHKDNLDGDKYLGGVFKKYTDQIVSGSFANSGYEVDPSTEFCKELAFKRTYAFKAWDKSAILFSVKDANVPYVPQGLIDVFNVIFDGREEEVRKNFGPIRDKTDEVILAGKLSEELENICGVTLTEGAEDLNALWKESVLAKENPNEFTFATYNDWYADYAGRVRQNAVPGKTDWKLNTPVVHEGTSHIGYFDAILDTDGTIRNSMLFVRTGNIYFPSIALKAYLTAKNYNSIPHLEFNPATGLKEVVDTEVLSLENDEFITRIPTDNRGRLLINYAGPSLMFPHFSMADLVSDSPDAEIHQRVWVPEHKKWEIQKRVVKKAEFLKDKLMVVGATATGIYDLRVTPFEENFPGPETHLNVLDNLVQGNFFRKLPDEHIKMPVFLAVVGLLLSIVLSYLGAVFGIGLTFAALMSLWYFDQYFLFGKGIVVSLIWPMFLVATLYIALTFYRYLTEERGKKELRQTFQKYVSPAIVEEILSDPKNIELGGKKVHLTVMFSDVRGFTTISEKLDPRALSDLLNSYLTPMTEIVFSNRGTLDKYMGDAIMAFFGAPITYKDHAKYACRCALQSIEKLFELQKEWEKKGLPTIDLGIGLNTGDVSVGNMGSETVRSYTVMGDAVNLASRLEGINKTYGTRIILSEMTYNEVKDSFICREVDWVRVKGKVLPVKIYELIAEKKLPSASLGESIKLFEEGYVHYHARAWSKGADCFKRALDITPTDEVAKLYLERCQDFLAEPPADTWDGVYIMKTK